MNTMYFDKEAVEEVEGEEEEQVESEEEIGKKSKTKQKKSKKKITFDDDEEEDDEEEEEEIDYEKTKAEFQDFINDDEVEEDVEEEDETVANGKSHKKSSSSSDNTDLEDDELKLIQENLGLNNVKSLKKRKRIRLQDDSSENDEDAREPQPKERKKPSKQKRPVRERYEDAAEEVDEGEQQDEGELEPLDQEEDDFIVDDDDDEEEYSGAQSAIRRQQKRKHVYTDEAQQEALDIFGVNAEELGIGDESGHEDDEEVDEEYEDEEEMDEDEGADQLRRRQRARKLKSKHKMEDIFEPAELERNFLTENDQQIRIEDKPERFMLRSIQVTPESNDTELDREAEWIYKQIFDQKMTISQQDFSPKPSTCIAKIRDVLNFMRNQYLDIPFIVAYRKEYISPELSADDVWKIYEYDERYVQLKQRKDNLIRLMQRMQKYQFEQLRALEPHMENLNISETQLRQLDSIRAIEDSDLDRIRNVQTSEEFMDCYQHFKLYYSHDIDNMRKKENDAAAHEGTQPHQRKQAGTKDLYHLYRQSGLTSLAKKFGLTPEQFGENLMADYQKHEIDQEQQEPMVLAQEFVVDDRFTQGEQVLAAARQMVATQLSREPSVRSYVRDLYMKRATFSVRPTQKGMKEIDENHVCYAFKYLKDKPVISLRNDQFLRLHVAEVDDKLLEIKFNVDSQEAFEYARNEASRLSINNQQAMDTDDFDAPPPPVSELNPEASFYQSIDSLYRTPIVDKLKFFYHKDEFSYLVEQWNEQRDLVMDELLSKILYPQMEKELRAKLLNESKMYIKRMVKNRLSTILKIAPYKPDTPIITYDGLYEYGCKLFAIAYNPDEDGASYCVSLNGNGDLDGFIQLRKLTLRTPKTTPTPGSHLETNLADKKEDFDKLKEFIIAKKPQVIAISAENRSALVIQEDVKQLLAAINQENNKAGTSRIAVELVDNELAKLYSVTKISDVEFKDQHVLLKLAVALGRYLQDPLLAFSQLCNPDNDALSFKYHSLQEYLTKDELKQCIECEFINFTNQVGVDLNRCVQCPYTTQVLQFVSGLGPRKAQHILKVAKQKVPVINRTYLVTECTLGSKVFINCAGFIRLDVDNLSKDYEDDNSDYQQTDVLDSTRIHPEAYEWARKMAIDALDMDDTNDAANANAALKEILESPERLNHLDLDAFAAELERTGLGLKKQTLNDIKNELFNRFADTRHKLELSQNEIFHMLTKETPQTLYTGKMVLCRVTGFSRMNKKNKNDEGDDEGEPVRDQSTGLWKCPKCKQATFNDLSEVWNHLDGTCPGKASGVNVVLDNSLNGFIPLNCLSDSRVKDPEERVQRGQTIYARIVNINTDRFSVKLTSKSSDLRDDRGEWRPAKDQHYDKFTENEDLRKIEEKKKREEHRQTYTKRVIAHPQFKNVGYQQAVTLLTDSDIGDAIVRPSSKGDNHLTVTWKVNHNIYQHVDIIEEKKINSFSLGKRLIIDGEDYEDLDEILARFVHPMVGLCREVYSHKYYRPELDVEKKEQIDALLLQEQRQAPNKIPYFFICDKRYPGKFLLAYMVRLKARHEHFTVTPEGFRFRNVKHKNFNSLVNWFKKHFHEPIPAPISKQTPSQSKQTPAQTPYSISNATPYNPPSTQTQVAPSNDDWDDGPSLLSQESIPPPSYRRENNFQSNRVDNRGCRGAGGDRGEFRGARGGSSFRDNDNYRSGRSGPRGGRGDYRGGSSRGDFRGGRGGGGGGRRDWDRGSGTGGFNGRRSSQNRDDEWDGSSMRPARQYPPSTSNPFNKPPASNNNDDDDDWDTHKAPVPKTSTNQAPKHNNDDWDTPSVPVSKPSSYQQSRITATPSQPSQTRNNSDNSSWNDSSSSTNKPPAYQQSKAAVPPALNKNNNNDDDNWD